MARWILLLVLLLAAGTARAQPGCLVVFGQGRNAGAPAWDEVNLAFNAEVARVLQDGGERVVALLLRSAATDRAANAARLLARTLAEGCGAIVETTVFADAATDALVLRLRHHPLETGADGAPRIGAARYVVERQLQLDRGSLERLQPAALARTMAAELLERGLR